MKRQFWVCVGLTISLGSWSLSAPSDNTSATSIVRSVPGSRIIPPTSTYTFPHTKYVYSVQWHRFHAGTSTIQIERVGNLEHVTATADSAGFPNKLYKVHDHFAADVDGHNYCTLHISKHNEEGPHRRDISIGFDYAHATGFVDTKDLRTAQSSHQDFPIPGCLTDVITGFFYVASLPLAPGYSANFPVNDNGKTSDISIEVEARETVKIHAGEFATLRAKVEPVAGPMKGKGTLRVWFTDDGRKIPVAMESKLGFATLQFELQAIEPPPGK
jgi:Protein of unknown function (DUF3108)